MTWHLFYQGVRDLLKTVLDKIQTIPNIVSSAVVQQLLAVREVCHRKTHTEPIIFELMPKCLESLHTVCCIYIYIYTFSGCFYPKHLTFVRIYLRAVFP